MASGHWPLATGHWPPLSTVLSYGSTEDRNEASVLFLTIDLPSYIILYRSFRPTAFLSLLLCVTKQEEMEGNGKPWAIKVTSYNLFKSKTVSCET